MNGFMKGIIKTGVIFSAVFVAAIALFYVLPVFAGPGITLTRENPSPANNTNVSTVGLARGYFFVNISINESLISLANLEVYNLSDAGSLFMNFTMTNSTDNTILNYTYFNVTGLFNGTFTWRVVGVNTSSLGANQTFGNFTVTLGQIYNAVITNPTNNTNTANDLTPEIRVSANSTFLTNMSLTLYTNKAGVIQAVRNLTILNGTETAFNLTQLTGGTYNIIAEAGNGADFKVNSTALTIVVTYLEANATLDVSNVRAGAEQNYTFTVANNGTDTIDRINITYDAGFEDPVAGDIVCPITTNIWNRSVDATNNMVSCIMPDRDVDSGITSGNSKTIKVENWSASNVAGNKTFLVDVRGLKNGNSSVVANMPAVAVFGNLTITGTSRAAAANQTGTTNLTMISFNFSATGEQMNITQIILTRNGTVTDADIVEVKLYNSTRENVGAAYNATEDFDIIAVNSSAPSNGRYTFSGLNFRVNSSQIVIVVVNVSSSATGGRTMNFSIEGAADVTSAGNESKQAITETFASQRSTSTTLYGTVSVTGASRAPATSAIGAGNVTVISFNFTTTGEAVNITGLNITLNGTGLTAADIKHIGLYNSTSADAGVLDGSGVNYDLIQWNISEPVKPGDDTTLRYNFSNIAFNVSSGATNVLLVVVNVSGSATGGHKFNASIEGAGDIISTGVSSGQSLVETLATMRSDNSTIYGNLSIVGTSRVSSTTQIGSKNVTVISFNFTATGEDMNITGINITINGTNLAVSNIDRVALYNSTLPNANVFNGTVSYDLIAWNNSAPVVTGSSMRYNFSNLGKFNVSSSAVNTLLVVINLTDEGVAGRTFNASIEGAADVVTKGGTSNLAITETISGQRSTSSTIYGNVSVVGSSIAPAGADVGQIGVGFLKLTLNATGEAVNISSINITSNNTRNQDVLRVRLFDDLGGTSTGTYERNADLPVAGATGSFGGDSSGSVLLTPTNPINISVNSLHYVYVVFDINTSATAGLDRLGASIQSVTATTAQGNDSYVSGTPQLTTGDPGAVNVDIRNLTGTASAITTGTAVARTGAGTLNNFTVTVNNTATGTLKDSIDEIRILFGGTGFTFADQAGNATCPTIASVPWNRTIISANIIVCNVTDSGGRLAADTNTTISLENFTASGTAGIYQLNVSVRGALGGVFNVSSNPSISVYGNLTAKATNGVNATTEVGKNRITFFYINLSASGEAMNVSEILVTFNGTGLVAADIASVELYNSTDKSTTIVNGSQTLIRTNVTPSAPDLTYNFSGLNLSVPADVTGQIVLVVANISGSATGGHVANATVINNNNMVTIGSLTGINAAENFTTQVNSTNTTIIGNLSIVGTSRVSSTTAIGTNNITIISFNFTAAGEAMNISGINITINGSSITAADIVGVALYNSTLPNANVFNGTVSYDLIAWNNSAPVKPGDDTTLRYNFSNLGKFNVSAGETNTLLVVINLSSSATGGRAFNASIEGAADVVTTSAISDKSITETFVSQRSATSTILGTLSITGTSRVATYTRLGTNNVTIISFNVSSSGEAMNITGINITLNGTRTTADIARVGIYNSTLPDAGVFNGTVSYDLIAWNNSEPVNGRYNFSNIAFNISSGGSNTLLVVVNVSSSAIGGLTFNASIEGAADVVTTGVTSGSTIAETVATPRSDSSTLVSLIAIGTSRAPATAIVNKTNITLISFNVSALGEQMNISGINITINGTVNVSAIASVGIYNSTLPDAGVFNGTVSYDLIAWNNSEHVGGGANTLRYNFSNRGKFNVSVGSNTLLVVVNLSGNAAGGATFNASIEGAADMVTTGGVSGLDITETLATQRSSSTTIFGNLSVTATDSLASWTRLGSTNVTVLILNFTATGEQMNVSEIILTRNGTVTDANIIEVKLYSTDRPDIANFNGSQTPLVTNLTPSANRYNFSNINLSVPAGATGKIVLVVVNVSGTNTGAGGSTFNFSVESASDIVSSGNTSYQSIAETLTGSIRSNTSTLVGINVTATALAPSIMSANQTATAMLNISVTSSGESMNITSFNFTLTGNATTGNISDVRLYRDDAAPLGAFTDADTYLVTRGTFNEADIQLNLSVINYNLSVPTSATRFFVTFNISGGARTWATVGVQLTPSGIAAVGNASGLAISVTGNSVASTNSTIQSEANLIFGTVTSNYPWITNKTTLVNTTNISIPITNGGAATATLTSVLITFLSEANANNASSNFTVVRADTVASIAGGVTTTLNFTVNATTGAQLVGRVNASVMLRYNDSNSAAAVTAGPVETNTSGLFGVDGTSPTISIVNPVLSGNVSGNQVDVNFTLNDTGSGVNRSAIAISINSVARNATCNSSGLNFTCNFTLFSSDSLFVFGSITARITNITDNATNSASTAEINFTLNNNDGVANLTRPIVGADPYALGWNTIQMPTQTMMEQQGRNASNTGDFNFTSLMASLGTSWTHMYYNTNGTSTGWVLATRTDFAGSTLKYLNNTNANPYWINMTSRGMVFKI